MRSTHKYASQTQPGGRENKIEQLCAAVELTLSCGEKQLTNNIYTLKTFRQGKGYYKKKKIGEARRERETQWVSTVQY